MDANILKPDLTAEPSHVLNQLVVLVQERLNVAWGHETETQVHRLDPVTTVELNYDLLRYPQDNASRSPRYTRYLSPTTMLRTHTSAMIPAVLPLLKGKKDATVLCPGITYRRDVTDRLHTGEPHQMDVWRVSHKVLTRIDLLELVKHVLDATLGDVIYRVTATSHPYTMDGIEVEVMWNGEWVEVLECGLAHPKVLATAGLLGYTGLALGVGLDRLAMLRKGIPDIRALRSLDPRIQTQMRHLGPWVEVSTQPAAKRDLSVAVPEGMEEEDICEAVREALGLDVGLLEEAAVVTSTPYADLPPHVAQRLGMVPGQKNLLVRVVLRDMGGAIPRKQANDLLNTVYRSLHCNDVGYNM